MIEFIVFAYFVTMGIAIVGFWKYSLALTKTKNQRLDIIDNVGKYIKNKMDNFDPNTATIIDLEFIIREQDTLFRLIDDVTWGRHTWANFFNKDWKSMFHNDLQRFIVDID